MRTSFPSKIMLSVMLVVVIMLSGCIIERHAYQYVGTIDSSQELNYNEVLQINHTKVKDELNNLGYNVTLSPNPPGLTARIYNLSKLLAIDIIAYEHNGMNVSLMITSYCVLGLYTKDDQAQIDRDKQYTKEKASEIANVCNITSNWNNAVWTINYRD